MCGYSTINKFLKIILTLIRFIVNNVSLVMLCVKNVRFQTVLLPIMVLHTLLIFGSLNRMMNEVNF